MTEDPILDDNKERNLKVVQEPLEYRILLTLLWLVWSAWSFYEGTIVLRIIQEGQGLLPLIRYHMGMVYEHYFIGSLNLGMAIIVFKQLEDRVFYLFSFLGIHLFLRFDFVIANGRLLVFVPMFVLFFLRNFKACLICYLLSYLLLLVLALNCTFNDIISLFTNPFSILFYGLLFMTVFSHRKKFFPLSRVSIKLRYRLYTLLGLLPSILERFL